MVDENKLVLRPAVEISYLTLEEQGMLLAIMGRLDVVPTLEQAQQLKMYSQDRQLTETKMKVVLARKKPAAMQVTLKKDRLKQYFPQTYTQKQMEDVIFSLLKGWKSQQEGVGAGDENE
jgi:ParB family chromosome partitioning protein